MDTTSTRGPYTHLSWCTAGECVEISHNINPSSFFFVFFVSCFVIRLHEGWVGSSSVWCLFFLTSRIPENQCLIEIHADKENTQSISGYRSSPQSF